MEVTYQTRAIILNRLPFKEDGSKIIAYCADQGKLELIARGTKKIKSKLAGHLEPISLSDLMIVRGRQHDYVGSAASEKCFTDIKNDLDKLVLAGRIINYFNQLIKPNQKDKAIFQLLHHTLKIIDSWQAKNINLSLIYYFFILKLLALLGYQPELHQCTSCRKAAASENNNFNIAQGGLVCRVCQKDQLNKQYLPISKNCIKLLKLIINNNIEYLVKQEISNQLSKAAIRIIGSFTKYHT